MTRWLYWMLFWNNQSFKAQLADMYANWRTAPPSLQRQQNQVIKRLVGLSQVSQYVLLTAEARLM